MTGVFVVLNTCDLDARKTNGRLPGIYLRDLDGCGGFRAQRGSDAVVCTGRNREVHAYFDGLCWQPALDYEELDDFVYQPFMTAYQDGGKAADGAVRPLDDLATYVLPGDKREAIAYRAARSSRRWTARCTALFGVELLCSYLEERCRDRAAVNDGTGAYLLSP